MPIKRLIKKDILPKVPKIIPKIKEFNQRLVDIIEEYTPRSRNPIIPFIPNEGGSSPKPKPLTQRLAGFQGPLLEGGQFQLRDVPEGERPVPIISEQRQLEIDLQEMFDALPSAAEQEMAYMDLRDQNDRGAQNQMLENALAKIGADTPTVYTRSPQTPVGAFIAQNMGRPVAKKKRKVSKYQKRFGVELKKLKKLHPRTKIQNLMKRAHRATKRAMK